MTHGLNRPFRLSTNTFLFKSDSALRSEVGVIGRISVCLLGKGGGGGGPPPWLLPPEWSSRLLMLLLLLRVEPLLEIK